MSQRTPVVHLFADELQKIGTLAACYPTIETGGELLGYWTHGGAPVVHLALGPGPNARHEPQAFYQDEAYMEACQERAWETSALQHVGEWHSHHTLGLAQPSDGDEQTVWNGMNAMGWSRFLLAIARFPDDDPGDVEVGFFLFESNGHRVTECEVRVLKGSSPLCSIIDDMPEPEAAAMTTKRPRVSPRLGTPSIAPFSEVETRGWYSTPGGQRRLIEELEALKILANETGAHTSTRIDGDRVVVLVEFSGRRLQAILPAGFPHVAPRIAVNGLFQSITWTPEDVVAAQAALLLTFEDVEVGDIAT